LDIQVHDREGEVWECDEMGDPKVIPAHLVHIGTFVCSLEFIGTTLSPMMNWNAEPINLYSLKSFRHGVWLC